MTGHCRVFKFSGVVWTVARVSYRNFFFPFFFGGGGVFFLGGDRRALEGGGEIN